MDKERKLQILAATMFLLAAMAMLILDWLVLPDIMNQVGGGRARRLAEVALIWLPILFFLYSYKFYFRQSTKQEAQNLTKKPNKLFIIIVAAFFLFMAILYIFPYMTENKII